MAKTKKSRNGTKHQTDPGDSDISNMTATESGKSGETANENRDGVTDQDMSTRDGSQEYVRPKGMDA